MFARPALGALRRLGAKDPILVNFRGSFALVGYAQKKKPHWVTQDQHVRYKGPSVISLRILLQSHRAGRNGIKHVCLKSSANCGGRVAKAVAIKVTVAVT